MAPQRYAERESQLEKLSAVQLAQRGKLCGLEMNLAVPKQEFINQILKAERIIR